MNTVTDSSFGKEVEDASDSQVVIVNFSASWCGPCKAMKPQIEALEAKTEGMVLGVGAKIFTIAGPVILYGTLASFVAGIVYWIISLF